MKEKCKNLKQFLEKKEKISGYTLVFGLAAMFFAGMVIGIWLSPKGDRCYGCYNGNFSGSGNGRLK